MAEKSKEGAALESVTDFVADKEMDESRVKEALKKIFRRLRKEKRDGGAAAEGVDGNLN